MLRSLATLELPFDTISRLYINGKRLASESMFITDTVFENCKHNLRNCSRKQIEEENDLPSIITCVVYS